MVALYFGAMSVFEILVILVFLVLPAALCVALIRYLWRKAK